jgi:hypothetical protein
VAVKRTPETGDKAQKRGKLSLKVRSFTKELLPPHLKETLTLVGLLLKRLKI